MPSKKSRQAALRGEIKFTHTMSFPCRSPVVPLPCHSAKGFPIWFTQCGRRWFTHTMAWYVWISFMCELNTAAMCKSNGKALSRMAWQGNGTITAGERHGVCESAFRPHGHWDRQIYTRLPPFLAPRFAASLSVLTQSPRTSKGNFMTSNEKINLSNLRWFFFILSDTVTLTHNST
jgi:hypothetical protein